MDREPGLRCQCGGETRVRDSRACDRSIRRRRECLLCRGKFTTFEKRAGEAIDLTAREAASAVVRIALLASLIRECEDEIKELSEILAP